MNQSGGAQDWKRSWVSGSHSLLYWPFHLLSQMLCASRRRAPRPQQLSKHSWSKEIPEERELEKYETWDRRCTTWKMSWDLSLRSQQSAHPTALQAALKLASKCPGCAFGWSKASSWLCSWACISQQRSESQHCIGAPRETHLNSSCSHRGLSDWMAFSFWRKLEAQRKAEDLRQTRLLRHQLLQS